MNASAIAEPPVAAPPATGAENPVARLRLRRDLQAISVPQDQRHQVLVIDAIAKRFLRLDGRRWAQLQQLSASDLTGDRQLVAEAAAAGLLRPSARPQAAALWRLSQLLAIRLPGIPADALARWLAARSGWLFSPAAVAWWLLLVVAAAAAIPIYWDRFSGQLPRLRVFLGSDNWLALAATLAATKLLHELAHAAVCRRSGARCGEIGVMLLCGVPCPYCDVTDSWRVVSRVRRAAVMLAGVYVELIMAALASLVWWATDDGRVHYAAMNVMVVCGVSTILFNLNPLMRYDGYHVLADMLGSVHLREEAADAFASLITRRVAGPGYAMPPAASPRIVGLALYHAAASCYRVLVAVMIALWIMHLADSVALRTAGVTAATGVLLAVPAGAMRRFWRALRGGGRWRGVGWSRRLGLGVAGGGLIAAACWLPLPQSIDAHGVIDAAGATPVYLPTAARIATVDAQWGDRVAAGQRLLLLSDPELQGRSIALAGQADVLRLRIAQLRRRAIDQPDLLRQWDTHSAAVQSVESQLQAAQQACDRLTVVAPHGGTVLPPPPAMLQQSATHRAAASVVETAGARSAAPAQLSDSRASDRIVQTLYAATGASTTADAMWCRIGDPQTLEAVLQVGSAQRRRVRVGDQVRIRCDQSPGRVLSAVIDSIDTVDRRHTDALSTESRFLVACRLPANIAGSWRIGATATARIRLPAEPLAASLLRWWQETFARG